jgi:hypothetical protein
MNEQNWNLQQDSDAYIPQKLPFFVEPELPASKLIKLQPTCESETTDKLFKSELEATLVQLPGTLPFGSLEPHDGQGLHSVLAQS